ncbi:hypothetical protein SASPL_145137 [Salvia splendens]|uniref:nicotinate phosphoribosyltransferase n=1 Tax=Salvia splendens TaxID=180675 RepID=A0A8X8WHX5_SALSN|nr:hypothetical protein SASPL_145137 [Salvia splendens]
MAERRYGDRRGDARGNDRGGGRGDLPNEERDIENGDLRQQARDLQRRLVRLEKRRGKSNPKRSIVPVRRSMDDPLFSNVFTSSDADEPSKNSESNIFSMPVYDTHVYDEDILLIPVYDKPVYDEDILLMPVYDKLVYDEDLLLMSKSSPPSVKFDDATKNEGFVVIVYEEYDETEGGNRIPKADEITEKSLYSSDGSHVCEDFSGSTHAWLRKLKRSNVLGGIFGETHQSELAAFASYALAFQNKFVALVGTYDVMRSELGNFCAIDLIMHDFGYKIVDIRLNFGDLAYLSCEARIFFKTIEKGFGVPELLVYVKRDDGDKVDSRTTERAGFAGGLTKSAQAFWRRRNLRAVQHWRRGNDLKPLDEHELRSSSSWSFSSSGALIDLINRSSMATIRLFGCSVSAPFSAAHVKEDNWADVLPNSKDFEDTIMAAVLGGESDVLKKKKVVDKRLKVFQDITTSLSPKAAASPII